MAALAAAAPAQAQAGNHAGHPRRLTSSRAPSATSSRRPRARWTRAREAVYAQHAGSSTFVLVVSGVGATGVGNTYGAHLHTGACVAGNGAAAGPHYNQSTVEGVAPVVSDQTEVWLDVTVGADGSGVAVAKVPFVPAPGNRAVVLHAEHTDDHGTAGARLACLPVSWS